MEQRMYAFILFILISSVIGLFVLFIVHVWNAVEFIVEKDKSNPEITFKQFINLYPIARNKWNLYSTYIEYNVGRWEWKIVEFKTLHDYNKYIRWMRQIDEQKAKRISDKNTILLLENWQKDIEAYKAKHEKQVIDMLKELHND